MNRLLFYIIYPFFLFAWLCNTSLAQQNLVPNGSFEEYWECPTNGSTPGDPQFEKCKYWYIPTEGTPDYFNTCVNSSNEVSIPNNIFGYQVPYSGNAYAGFNLLYVDFYNERPEYREYIQAKLNYQLENGQEYYLRFYVNKSNVYGLAIDRIGAYFSSYPISKNDAGVLSVVPQVSNPRHRIIVDTINWTEISGTFIATGGEQYITIGNFYTLEETDTLIFNPDWPDDYAYYYIDGVSLKEVESKINIPNVFTPNGDDINDYFVIESKSIIEYQLYIFNRWGGVIYSSNNINEKWDGKLNGLNCPEGVYYYTINAKGIEGKIYNLNGSVQLLR